MILQHKSKLRLYRELKREVGAVEYLEFVKLRVCKGSAFQNFLKFHLGTHGLFEKLGRHANKGGLQECPNCRACKESVGHVLFECSSYDSQRCIFDYLKQVLLPAGTSFNGRLQHCSCAGDQ